MSAQERGEHIKRVAGARLVALINEAAELARKPAPFQLKAVGFYRIAEELGAAITPHTPCAAGTCSHCCYMATAVSGWEAALIGRHIGRKPVALHREGDAAVSQAEMLERFTGTRCTFLNDEGRCGIYTVRPMACRLHHSCNDTEAECRINRDDPDPPKVPRMNLSEFVSLQAFVFLGDDYGDIREFFPCR